LRGHMGGGARGVSAPAGKLGLEGIVSKRRASAYRPGRSPDWVKRGRCKGRRQAEKAGVTPRIARTILRSADGDRPRRRRLDGMDTGSMLAAPLDTSIRGTVRFL